MQPPDLEAAATGQSWDWPYRVASLQRILTEALARGSVRKVLGAFVEALGVWDDVRVHAYAASASNGFFRYVSPMGALASAAPLELDDRVVPHDNGLVRLSRSDVEHLGLEADSGDAVVLRLETGDVSWILLVTGRIDEPEQVRLTLYADMLRESLNEVIAVVKTRLVATVTRSPLPAGDSLPEAVQAALTHLTSAVGGYQSALSVSATPGRKTLTVGNSELLETFDDRSRHDRLIVTSADPRSVMTVVVDRRQPRFAAFERAVAQAGVAALHPRLQEAIEGPRNGERRSQFRPVDTLFDQLAAETVGAGQPASVIVVSVGSASVGPALLQTGLGKIRAHLRAGDFAGLLSNTEIAVLLCDASADEAAIVSARLKQVLQSDDSARAFINPALGMRTRSPESAFEGSLVGAARFAASAD